MQGSCVARWPKSESVGNRNQKSLSVLVDGGAQTPHISKGHVFTEEEYPAQESQKAPTPSSG